jgi:branched-subunit amino acid aminotransferase/4-amino-4-deoxychorismate lyase
MDKGILNIGFNNGIYSKVSEINVPIDNLAIGRAYAAYEFFRVNKGKPFYLDRHLDRFFNSLKSLKYGIVYSRDDLKEIVDQLIVKNQSINYFLKIYAIPQNVANPSKPAWLYIIPAELTPFNNKMYQNGTSLLMKEYSRFLPEAKSNNYIASVFWQTEIEAIQAVDVLFVYNNQVFESSRGNIFIVKNGKVYTPDENILKGVTRSIVIDLMDEENIPYSIQAVSTNELLDANEVFLTSTTKLIMPIIKINDITIGSGLPGSVTGIISKMYNGLLE